MLALQESLAMANDLLSVIGDLVGKSEQHALSKKDRDNIENRLLLCRRSLDGGSQGDIALCFYCLGRLSYQHELSLGVGHDRRALEAIAVNKMAIRDKKRTAPLLAQNEAHREVIEIVQDIAKKLWEKPGHQDKRIGAMADCVWAAICEDDKYRDMVNDHKRFPDKASGLKPWIREVAPPHASKPGRSKSIK